MSRKTPYTKVEVVEERPDDAAEAPMVKVTHVLINGQPVTVAKDGIYIDYDYSLSGSDNLLRNGLVAVNVTLLVDEFTIKQVPHGYTDGISEWEVELLAEQQRKVDQVVEHFEDGHIRFKTKPKPPRDHLGRFTKRK